MGLEGFKEFSWVGSDLVSGLELFYFGCSGSGGEGVKVLFFEFGENFRIEDSSEKNGLEGVIGERGDARIGSLVKGASACDLEFHEVFEV